MMADVISIAVVGMHFSRAAVSSGAMWRMIYPIGRHLSVVGFCVLLQIKAQNFLLSACWT
ncbi:hypothetical protein [Bradyrhizobium sp. SYSU BS000235]|jgi:hypothetical protein|uniref:hypothetical protein n=1 Tax=Bradyrhizobium sp. SYSU BS000235 TaxID=3411332 RepID=UPI003C71ABBE